MIINHPSSHHQLKAWQTGGVHVRTLANFSDRPILLKNSLCADDGKILATRRREARGDLGGHQEQLPSSRRVSWHA